LLAVKKSLRKTASKNTAVSCHWIRSRSRSELVWVVGQREKFNTQGVVPVNVTSDSKQVTEHFALNTNVIALSASLAGYFHDVGKANKLFQNKLNGRSDNNFEPYRHEWVSLRIFQAFVNGRNDKEWLNDLASINNDAERKMLEQLDSLKDGIVDYNDIEPIFKSLDGLAKFIAWLIVSHHKLPIHPKSDNSPSLENINQWRETIFDSSWNSPQCLNDDWSLSVKQNNWNFPCGTPLLSAHWQTQISILAEKILKENRIFKKCWLDQQFTAHTARLSLMLADHYYSSNIPTIKRNPEWQDRNYSAYANTYSDEQGKRKLKQKLDEHNIAVGTYAKRIAKLLPDLRDDLPSLSTNKRLGKSTKNADFEWQNNAYSLAKKIRENTKKYGFFGICKASTGKGKTLGNARIMYGLSEEGDCRFNIALGLRTLTIQTANALEKDLDLKQGELALLVGSQAVKDLQSSRVLQSVISEQEKAGSESSEPLLKDDVELLKGCDEYTGEFTKWIEHDPKITKLIQSPILVSTIDYLMPANEGTRGGRQIAPMLRLLTSDLVLDEPDDFGLDDLPALCRLVNWAGMLGSRVLLSTATMPPVLASSLFVAYQAGRNHYTEVNGEQGINSTVCCAWFDEFKKPETVLISDQEDYEKHHSQFVDKRIDNLKQYAPSLRKAKLIDIGTNKKREGKPSEWLANNMMHSIVNLHRHHAINVLNKKVSIGLVRMANIDPLVQVTKTFLQQSAPDDTFIHYCIYHGQFPLIQRSCIERRLDAALTRKDYKEWMETSGIPYLIEAHPEKHHIFVVVATSVAEVGRDHDYDWAVIEPSSMRSIIQLAGRVQRHRKQKPKTENIHVLSTNYKGLKEASPNFTKPGFETSKTLSNSKNLFELEVIDQIKEINAIPRITTPENLMSKLTVKEPRKVKSFTALEYLSQAVKLRGSNNETNYASLWWESHASWCGELQRRQPFRQSALDDDYCLVRPPHVEDLRWNEKLPKTYPPKYMPTQDIASKQTLVPLAKGVGFWVDVNIENEVCELSKELGISNDYAIKKFTHISLKKIDKDTDEQWQWHAQLGVYKVLKKDKWRRDE